MKVGIPLSQYSSYVLDMFLLLVLWLVSTPLSEVACLSIDGGIGQTTCCRPTSARGTLTKLDEDGFEEINFLCSS